MKALRLLITRTFAIAHTTTSPTRNFTADLSPPLYIVSLTGDLS